MKYLLDSDTLIRSKNDAYRFDVCPGFWTWLEQANEKGIVFSIDRIKKELDKEDQLSNWVRHKGAKFFLKTDDGETQKHFGHLALWTQDQKQYSDAAKQEFLGKADFSLIGYARAHDYCVVTFEEDRPQAAARVFIPTVCKHAQIGVRCVNIFQVLSEQKVQFVLKG